MSWYQGLGSVSTETIVMVIAEHVRAGRDVPQRPQRMYPWTASMRLG